METSDDNVRSHDSNAARPEACLEDLLVQALQEYQAAIDTGEAVDRQQCVVYEAEQLSLARRVAVKILPLANLWSDTALQRFRNEVRLAAMLEHQHIVPIYSVGCERGVHFYAMKLLTAAPWPTSSGNAAKSQGRDADSSASENTVSALRRRSRVDTCVADVTDAVDADGNWHRAVARVGLKAAEALAFAHQQGIVHRDVKPSNLLFDREGRLYVSDFGLARLEADVSLTRTGDILGTPRYMSPEQASGKVVDVRTDIYSLGATLYELLTLEPVIPGRDRAETMRGVGSTSDRAAARPRPASAATAGADCAEVPAAEPG